MSSPFRKIKYEEESSALHQSKRSDVSALRSGRNMPLQPFNPRLYVSKRINQQDVIMIKQVFDEIDSTGKGILNPSDLRFSLQKFGFNANKEIVYDIIAEYDEQQAGGINFPQFMSIMARIPAQQESKDAVRKVFRKYDRKNKGFIEPNDIMNVVKELREDLSPQQLKSIWAKASCKTQGKMSFEEFYRLMTMSTYSE